MELHGWGRYPRQEAHVAEPLSRQQCMRAVPGALPLIARGRGRSYGDSALGPQVLSTRYLDRFHDFDPETGVLSCDAGVSLDDILRTFVPRGWFLPVMPGTRFITVGGAIASDVHGKNHHRDGTFSAHVASIRILLGNGECVGASPSDKAELFHATCGGMGLTGVIVSAVLRLKAITASDILETRIKTPSLDAVLEAFDAHAASAYSVAWIDCMARGPHLGRSILVMGEQCTEGPLVAQQVKALGIPAEMPSGLLNRAVAKMFNAAYYGRARANAQKSRKPFESFIAPLDAITGWSSLYGRPGFLQYQFVLPKASGADGLREILQHIGQSRLGAFLAVLKLFGDANANPLSFPLKGYSLAVDFKAEAATFELLDVLDGIVAAHGGRLYLAKDARMSEAMFKAGYPRWQEFEEVRARWHAHGKFSSTQSRRLGLA
jgi:decaprenylphospho-beta-D-ribofuranose 2-oxidase